MRRKKKRKRKRLRRIKKYNIVQRKLKTKLNKTMSERKPLEYQPELHSFIDPSTNESLTFSEASKAHERGYQRIPRTYCTMFEDFQRKPAKELCYEKELDVNETIDAVLFDYQREDIKRVVHEMNGRALLALGMGLGKTISSIAITDHFRRTAGRGSGIRERALLVVCPSYLRQNWYRELVKWNYVREDEAEEQILVIMKGKDLKDEDESYLPSFPVVIVSYSLLVRNYASFSKLRWLMIIVDESAYLKNRETKRVKTLGNYLKSNSTHVLLLSGTPALNCPRELFVQLNILYPSYFTDYFDFSIRYCEGHQGYFGWDDRGSCKEKELNYVLNQLMVRRLKKDVLTNLPAKQRQKVFLDVKITKSMQKNAAKLQTLNEQLRNIQAMDPDAPHWQKKFKERNTLISRMFTEVSHVKKKVVVEYLQDLVREKANTDRPKIIVFAHHQHVLDTLAEMADKMSWDYIRIDGTTAQNARQTKVDNFVDASSGVNLALLSLKACCTGLNFTPVTTMVFAELLFEISTLRQSEDRIHRIGAAQDTNLEYYYLVGTGTIDEKIFNSIDRKFTVLQKIMDDGNDRDGFSFVN